MLASTGEKHLDSVNEVAPKDYHFSGSDMTSTLPPIPTIGFPEEYYTKRVLEADQAADRYAHDAWKVGQYITLGLHPNRPWEQKVKCFRHAIRRHCDPPEPDDDVVAFYRAMADLVRQHAGAEALRLASAEDDTYATRVALGQNREEIEDEAETFFGQMIESEHCPDWCNESDYSQLKMIRDQWI